MNPINVEQNLLRDISIFSKSSIFDIKGLDIYQRNLWLSATNALAISYPTINLLLGNNLLRVLTKEFILIYPKHGFDWATWGSEFPLWLKQHTISREIPYFHDCALLDWCIHLNHKKVNTDLDINSLSLLNSKDMDALYIEFNAGIYVIESRYPIVDIYQAHRINPDNPELSQAQTQLKLGKGQKAMISLNGWNSTVIEINENEYYWLDLINNPQSLGQKLTDIKNNNQVNMAFEHWFPKAIEQKLIHKIKNLNRKKS